MKTTTLLSKTGKTNMGGYFKETTTKLDKIEGSRYPYRVYYMYDSCDECYDSIEEATIRFNKISEYIIKTQN
tara:strand:+ start:274 stop:489 length:216 start_codon:yes stop_codon:yes gene_type:complete